MTRKPGIALPAIADDLGEAQVWEPAQRVTVHTQAAAWMWLMGIPGGPCIVFTAYLGWR